MNLERYFNSKILLFGEYGVIQNSQALAIPYELFRGRLAFPQCDQHREFSLNSELKAFARYLEQLQAKGKLGIKFDFTSMEFDLAQGLFFESSIPMGLGLGSSGALCAAVFARYHECKALRNDEKPDSNSLCRLKNIFAQMESHFHGASSGVDPLISFTNRPLLLEGKDSLQIVPLPLAAETPTSQSPVMFLLNTELPRRTGPLVNLYLEKCKNKNFLRKIHQELLPINRRAISAFLQRDGENLFGEFLALSQFQRTHLNPMIPPVFCDLWEEGIASGHFALKLCGAGGGGLLLGIARNGKKLAKYFSNFQIRPLGII